VLAIWTLLGTILVTGKQYLEKNKIHKPFKKNHLASGFHAKI
jgi:hypothetical protein